MLAHWNNSPQIDMSIHPDPLFWFWDNQSVFPLLSATYLEENQYVLISQSLVWSDRDWNPRSTTLEAYTLPVLIRQRLEPTIYHTRGVHTTCVDPTEAGTHDLPHSRRTHYLCWSDRGWNPRSTTLEAYTLPVLIRQRLEPTIYRTRGVHTTCVDPTVAGTHDLPHSKRTHYLCWSDRGWNPRSTALEAYTLPVLIRQRLEPTIYHTRGVHTTCVDPTEAGTHDLPHSWRTHYLCWSDRGWNPRSTALEAYTLPVLIRQRLEPTIYRTRGVHTTCVDPTVAGTHDLPHSRRTHYLCWSDRGWNPRSTALEAYTLPVLIRQRLEPTIYRTRGVHTTCVDPTETGTHDLPHSRRTHYLCWSDRGWNPRSTALEAYTLPVWIRQLLEPTIYHTRGVHTTCVDPTEAGTHDLPHSRRTHYLCGSDSCWNPRSTTLEAYTLPVWIRQWLEPTIYHTRGVHTTCVDPTEAETHDLPHSRRTHYLCWSDRGWNPRSTTLEAYTLPVLIRQRLEPTIYHTRGVHTTCAQSMQLDTVCNYYTVIWSKTRFVLRSILDVSFNTRKCLYDRLNFKYLSCVMKHWHCKNKLISI